MGAPERSATIGWLVTANKGQMGRMDLMGRWWDGVGRMNVSRRRNRIATMGSGTGAPPLALEGRRAMQSVGWHQLCRCRKDAEYLFRRSKIIQIECTQIRTSNVVQDGIKSTHDTILLWMHTTINRTYNVIVPKKKSQKNADPNIEDSVRY